ncbi:hypothetical protein D3C80_1801680 [compost metagenome]
MALSLAERRRFECRASQRLIGVPILFGDVIPPVIGFVHGSMEPGKRIHSRLDGIFCPYIHTLLIKRGIMRNAGAGQFAIAR